MLLDNLAGGHRVGSLPSIYIPIRLTYSDQLVLDTIRDG